MLCCKKIQIDDWPLISGKIFFFIKTTEIYKTKYSWNTVDTGRILTQVPALQTAFDRYDLIIKTAAVIYRPPHFHGGVHIDNGTSVRALIPVRNCQGSYTKFFQVDRSKIQIKYGKDGDRYSHIPPDAILNEIASIETVEPLVFNPQIPHGVYSNNSLEPRWTLTLGFDRSPVELLDDIK